MLFFSGSKHRKFLSTPSARRATAAFSAWPAGMSISIHALREEGDSYRSIKHRPWTHFYPRPPRGGRPGSLSMICFLRSFLSTPSARRATPERRIQRLQQPISIHALREEGDGFVWGIRLHLRRFLSTPSARRATVPLSQLPHAWGISIHALREEGDPHRHHLSKLAQKFLSTPSARRATCCRPPARGLSPISIHALREEGDP